MTNAPPTREDAWNLLTTYNQSDSLRKHALAVEGVMRHFARKYGEDETQWGVIGLIHDLDYEQFPEQHCTKTRAILEENGWPEDYIRAVVSHGYGICSDVEPKTKMEKVLFAIDELSQTMLVMGSQGRTGLKHLMLGSKAEQVTHLCQAPVLIVKQPA